MTGIYKISNVINGRIYVGSAYDLTSRKQSHFRSLLLNDHNNRHLQNSYNKYGKENLIFEVLEYCEKENLPAREFYWAKELNAHDNKTGFNIRPIDPIQRNGGAIAQESKDLIGKANRGRKHTAETILHLSTVKKGRPCHPNTYKAALEEKNRYQFSESDKISASSYHYKPVSQLTVFEQLIETFASAKEAQLITGLDYGGIIECCRGVQQTYKGYLWKYQTKFF